MTPVSRNEIELKIKDRCSICGDVESVRVYNNPCILGREEGYRWQYVSVHKSWFRMTNSLRRRATKPWLPRPSFQKYDVIYMKMHRNLCHLEI